MKRVFRTILILLLSVLPAIPAGLVSVADTVMIGDVDGDGKLTTQDANCITQHLANISRLDAAQRSRADFDNDGKVTSMDASLIMSAINVREERPQTVWNATMLITADLSGTAWGSDSEDQRGACSALNIATYVAAEREADERILLLDAGGSLYGSTIADEYELYTEKIFGPMTAVFARLGYSAILLGDEAITYPSYRVRNEMDWVKASGTKVIGTNLVKANPASDEPEITPWNEILPYAILEAAQGEDEPVVRIGVIGFVNPDLAAPTDEVKAIDPKLCYERIANELRENCDMVLMLYHGNLEDDESKKETFSLRSFIQKTSGIDFVLVSHGAGEGAREERNADGAEVPIIQLSDDAASVLKLSVAKRADGGFVYGTDRPDMHAYEPDEGLKRIIHPYVSGISMMMDAPICTLEQNIERSEDGALGSTDSMELLHEMQIWAVKSYMAQNWLDMPPNVLSIAYPYIDAQGLSAGALRYRDLCALPATVPQYTLLMLRGEELRAWLTDYASRIGQQQTVYSIYGLSYMINTWNTEIPLAFLGYSADVEIEDDEIFTVLLAEDPDEPSGLLNFLDETWMPMDERTVGDFAMPQTRMTDTAEQYAAVTPLVAFLESLDTFSLRHTYSWLVI